MTMARLAMGLRMGQSGARGSLSPWVFGFHDWIDFAQNIGSADLLSYVDTHANAHLVQAVDGTWSSKAANVQCRSDLGQQVVPTRTNGVPNNSRTGAVAGTPGTMPTGWVGWASSRELALTTHNGLPTITYRDVGTPVGTPSFLGMMPDNASAFPVTAGSVYTASVFIALAAGALPAAAGGQMSLRIKWIDAGGSQITVNDAAFTPTSTFTRFTNTQTAPANAAFVHITMRLSLNVGVPNDFTLVVGAPQIELGAYASPPILTTAGAVTRIGNVVTKDLGSKTTPGFGGALRVDVKGFTPAALPILLGISPNSQVGQALIDSIYDAGTLVTGVQTLAFAHSPGYAKARWVGASDTVAQAPGYQADPKLALGGNGFDANNNIYAIYKRLGLRYEAFDNTKFATLFAQAEAMAA